MPDLYRYTPNALKTDSQKAVAKQFAGRNLEILNCTESTANVIDRNDPTVLGGKVFSNVGLWQLERVDSKRRRNDKDEVF